MTFKKLAELFRLDNYAHIINVALSEDLVGKHPLNKKFDANLKTTDDERQELYRALKKAELE
jgi:hypothetical protein